MSGERAAAFDRHVLKFKIAFQHYVKREDFDGRDVNAYLDDIVGWIKFGYERAGKRFRKLDGQALMRLFSEIEEQAEQLLKSAGPGAVLEVSVNLAKCSSKARVSFPGF